MFITTHCEHKKIRNFITALLKNKEVSIIKRFNYVASYQFIDGKIEKKQEKCLILQGIKNQKKIENLANKILGKANYTIHN